MQHDVIIVGAGPAGSAAAIIMANRGHDVLLIDQHKFPRDKVCGDGIPPGSVQLLNQLGLDEKIRTAGFNQINAMRVVSPNNMALDFSFTPKGSRTGFYIAPRREFDYLLQQQALSSGAKFLADRVSGVSKHNSKINGILLQSGQDITARVVVGADGSNSIVSRSLHQNQTNTNSKLIGIRGYISGLETVTGCAEYYFLKAIFPSYGWIFPTGPTTANIGLGLYVSAYQSLDSSLQDLLDKFLQHEHIRERLAQDHQVVNAKAWFYHLAEKKLKPVAFNGAVLVGDAATLMDPLSGEGIRNALHSGIIAGEVIHDALTTNDCTLASLQEYEKRCKSEIYRIIRRSLFLRRVLSSSPARLEWVFRKVQNNKTMMEKLFSSISSNFKI